MQRRELTFPSRSNEVSRGSSPSYSHHSPAVESIDHEEASFILDALPSRLAPKTPLIFTNGLALVIGLQIGSGIFSAPSQVASHTPSPGVAVIIWAVAGIVVWSGAASFVELGLAIPKNGGVQEYLRAIYGDSPFFMFS